MFLNGNNSSMAQSEFMEGGMVSDRGFTHKSLRGSIQ